MMLVRHSRCAIIAAAQRTFRIDTRISCILSHSAFLRFTRSLTLLFCSGTLDASLVLYSLFCSWHLYSSFVVFIVCLISFPLSPIVNLVSESFENSPAITKWNYAAEPEPVRTFKPPGNRPTQYDLLSHSQCHQFVCVYFCEFGTQSIWFALP